MLNCPMDLTRMDPETSRRLYVVARETLTRISQFMGYMNIETDPLEALITCSFITWSKQWADSECFMPMSSQACSKLSVDIDSIAGSVEPEEKVCSSDQRLCSLSWNSCLILSMRVILISESV